MKGFFIKFFDNVFSYGMAAFLVYAVMKDNHSSIAIAATAYWVAVFIHLFISILTLLFSFIAKFLDSDELKKATIDLVNKAVNKGASFFVYLSLARMIVIAIAFAYSGWVFTAVSYLIGYWFFFFVMRVSKSICEAVTNTAQADNTNG